MSKSDLEYQLSKIVGEYFNEIDEDLDEAVEEAANEGMKAIKKAAPKNEGKYRRGWKMDLHMDSYGEHQAVIYNAKTPSLTWLLEEGHLQVLWGEYTNHMTPGIPHIAPGYEIAAKALMERLK